MSGHARRAGVMAAALIAAGVNPAPAQSIQWGRPQRTAAPEERYLSGLVYDSRRGVAVLFGGSDHIGNAPGTWEWDGVAWKLCTLAGPPPRSARAMAYDSRRGVTVLFGGNNGT